MDSGIIMVVIGIVMFFAAISPLAWYIWLDVRDTLRKQHYARKKLKEEVKRHDQAPHAHVPPNRAVR
jgi:hypothetical protein